jgi:hypothetical protein
MRYPTIYQWYYYKLCWLTDFSNPKPTYKEFLYQSTRKHWPQTPSAPPLATKSLLASKTNKKPQKKMSMPRSDQPNAQQHRNRATPMRRHNTNRLIRINANAQSQLLRLTMQQMILSRL